VTTEGGLDVASQVKRLTEVVAGFHEDGIAVSMFIDPDPAQVEASVQSRADAVELHTGAYANAPEGEKPIELERLGAAAYLAVDAGLAFHAGHGLTVHNLAPVAAIPDLREVNIGHDIIARAVFIGIEDAVHEILDVLAAAGGAAD